MYDNVKFQRERERERESINYCPLFVEINFLDLKYMFRERERKRVSIYGIKYMLREERGVIIRGLKYL